MGIIKEDEIRGYLIEGEVVCLDCAKDEGTEDLKEDQVLTDKEVEGDRLYFCDRCKKKL